MRSVQLHQAMLGLVKIGYTTQDDANSRIVNYIQFNRRSRTL